MGTQGEAPLTDSSSDSNSNSNSNSNSDSNSNLRSSFTVVNLQSNWGTKADAPLACHGRNPFTDNHIETKFEITNKFCNRCRVINQITCFDKKQVKM